MLKYITHIVFWGCLLLSIVGLLLVHKLGFKLTPILLVSIGLNVWAIVRSEQEGFVRTRQARRAYEPPRHLNGAQMMILVLLVMAELGIGIHAVLTE